MAKLKYDVSGSDPDKAKGGDFKQPKPGVYRAKVIQCDLKKPDGKDERLEVVYEISDKEFKGSRLFEYINTESEAAVWKLDQFLQAVGITTSKKRKGTVDLEEIVGTVVKVRVKGETYQGEYRARAGTVMSLEDGEDDSVDDDGDDDSDGDDADDSDDGDDSDAEPDDDYDEWSIPDLRKELKARELNTKGTKTEMLERLRESDADGPY